MRGRIQKILGSGRHDSPLRAEGTITRTDGRFRLDLVVQIGGVAGTRTLVSKSCEDLAGAAAVEVGLLIHSVEAGTKAEPAGNPPPTLPPVGEPGTSGSGSEGTTGLSSQGTKDASTTERASDISKPVGESEVKKQAEVESEAGEPPPRAESQRRWHVLLQAPLVALGVGPLPPLAMGVGLSLGFEYAHWQLYLRGLSWRRQNVPASDFPGYGADVDRIGAAFGICREYRVSWFGLSPCLGAGLERVTASGTGSNILPSSQKLLGMNAGAGVQGRIHLASWIRLLVAVAGEIELIRPQISIEGLGILAPPPTGDPPDPPTPVYRFAPAALTGTLSLEWAL